MVHFPPPLLVSAYRYLSVPVSTCRYPSVPSITCQYPSVPVTAAATLHYLPVPAFVGTYAFEQALGLQCGNLFFHGLGSYAYPFCEGDCRQGIVLKKQVEDFLPTFCGKGRAVAMERKGRPAIDCEPPGILLFPVSRNQGVNVSRYPSALTFCYVIPVYPFYFIVLPGYCLSATSRHFIAAFKSDSLST